MKFLVFTFFSFCSLLTIAQKTTSPKLMVGIVVDQMTYDYLYRFQSKFSDGGFRLLMNKGTNCRTTLYNYVPTYTGPGHASIYTGTVPANHGIVGNDWYEFETGKVVNCVEDLSVESVGTNSSEGKCSPKNLKTYTITDQLKLTYPKAKVISMSIKDRGAILPGGHLSDGSYWFDYATGKFVTSSFYKKELPTWVNDFNDKKNADVFMETTWNTLLPIENYFESDTDNSPYEHLLPGKSTPTFPYDLKAMQQNVNKYEIFTSTPFANTFLADFAIQSIDAELLGKDNQADMLCISFSTPDIAGHAFGPNSIEMEDIYLRLDLEIEKLIKALNEKVGKNQFTLFLTADHAVVPVPQRLIDHKMPGGYVFLNEKIENLKLNLKTTFGFDPILEVENQNIYIDENILLTNKTDIKNVLDFIKAEIRKWENVKEVYTQFDLENVAEGEIWKMMVKNGVHRKESGQLVFILEPGFLPKSVEKPSTSKGTSHGSAFNYDTHVPLLMYGKNIPKKEVFKKLNIIDVAPTIGHLLNLQRSGAMTGEPIIEILEK